VSGAALAADSMMSFGEPKKVWEASRNRKEYQTYGSEFARFNNNFHLDTKDGCYSLGGEAVELMLVIAHRRKEPFATIEQVLSSVENEKARCFMKSYIGIPTKTPPFFPFVLQMHFD
jgi:hypothetical protein